MNAINTQAELASTDANTTNAVDELLSHLWRMKTLSRAVEGTYCSLLEQVDQTDKPTRLTADRLSVFLELLDEEIDKADGYAQEIEFAAEPEPITSVGKHVDIQLRSAWTKALEAYHTESRHIDPCFKTVKLVFDEMIATRVPDISSLRAKIIAIDSEQAWTEGSVLDALCADIEHLARRYEIAAEVDVAEPSTPPEWQAALDEFACARLLEVAHPQGDARFDDPLYETLKQDNIRAFKRVQDALRAVIQMPAQNPSAAADKLQALIDYHNDADSDLLGHLKEVAADLRRLNGEG